jgi:hypothetical protein
MTKTLIVRRLGAGLALTACLVGGPWSMELYAQGRAGRQGPGPAGRAGRPGPQVEGQPGDVITPGQLQDLLDAMVVMQAERDLRLSDEQFRQFLVRLRGLQGARRRGENQRNRLLMELRRLMQAAGGTPDETQVRERLKALDDSEAQSVAEIKQARTNLDQILDIRQQARFRLLEEQMERRKLELFARSRQPVPPR